jgi:hypothetical protein
MFSRLYDESDPTHKESRLGTEIRYGHNVPMEGEVNMGNHRIDIPTPLDQEMEANRTFSHFESFSAVNDDNHDEVHVMELFKLNAHSGDVKAITYEFYDFVEDAFDPDPTQRMDTDPGYRLWVLDGAVLRNIDHKDMNWRNNFDPMDFSMKIRFSIWADDENGNEVEVSHFIKDIMFYESMPPL